MYAKVFAQMYDGSLCTNGSWEALVTFQQFLVLADQDGTVDMTAEAIARRTTIPLNIITKGIEELQRPDKRSRTPTDQGRRIVPLSDGRDWGWLVVNYKHYRELKREEDRRAYHREYWHKRKLKDSTDTQQPQPNQPIAEAEAKAEARKPISGAHSSPDGSDKKRGSRLPEGWEPGEDGLLFSHQAGIAGQRFHDEAAKFRDYWSAQPGAKGRKTDWQATWRNWCRNVQQKPSSPPVPQWKRDQLARIAEFAGPAAAKPRSEAIDVDSRFLDG